MAYVASTSKSGLIQDIGAVEILIASGAGDVVFKAPHSAAPVVLLGDPSSVTVSAITQTGCTVDGACTLVIIG